MYDRIGPYPEDAEEAAEQFIRNVASDADDVRFIPSKQPGDMSGWKDEGIDDDGPEFDEDFGFTDADALLYEIIDALGVSIDATERVLDAVKEGHEVDRRLRAIEDETRDRAVTTRTIVGSLLGVAVGAVLFKFLD